jgi:hypothetical protein
MARYWSRRQKRKGTESGRASWSGLVASGLCFIAIGIIQYSCMDFSGQRRKDAALDERAHEVGGVITDKREISGENYGSSEGYANHPFAFDFTYEYPPGHRRQATSRTREARLCHSLNVGDRVVVEVLPGDPELARIAGMPFRFGPAWIEVVVVGVMGFGILLVIVALLRRMM